MTVKTSPAVSERAHRQRERILEAAQKCFVESGFHAASMSSIANAAQMSPSLIYRYFENKHAIVLAIIERQLEEKRSNIAMLQSETELRGRIRELYDAWVNCDPKVMNAPLFLEMTAEASRKQEIADAVRCADEVTRDDLMGWLQRYGESQGNSLGKPEARWRSLALQVIIEGLLLRAIREPGLDHRLVTRMLDELLSTLIPENEA